VWLTLEEAARRTGRTVDEIRAAVILGEREGRPTPDEESYEVFVAGGRAIQDAEPGCGTLASAAAGAFVGLFISFEPLMFFTWFAVAIILVAFAVSRNLVFAASMLAVILLAVAAPTKHVDRQRFKPLPRASATFAELQEASPRRLSFPKGQEWVMVQLPSQQPTLREVADAIESQTDFECEVAGCGTGASLWGGAYPLLITIRPRRD
jgi:hypothetical protein